MSTATEIILALSEALPRVAEYTRRTKVVPWFPKDPPMYDAIPEDVEAHIKALAIGYPLFATEGVKYFGAKELRYHHDEVARLLINKAMLVGPEKAFDWLTKVYKTMTADIRQVAEVYGLVTFEQYTLASGIHFCPVNSLPRSRYCSLYRKEYFDVDFRTFRYSNDRVIMAFREMTNVTASVSPPQPLDRIRPIERAVRAHVVVEQCAPYLGRVWEEFIDPALEDADPNTFSMSLPQYEGAIPNLRHPGLVAGKDTPKIDAVLAIQGELADRLDVAANRLIMARNRTLPANRALDGCICLEALLSDRQPGELTYKLSLRAAILLETDIGERMRIRKVVEDFYRLRSKAVHGEHGNKSDDLTIADAGLTVCARVIDKIVERGAIPKWKEFEMQG